MFVSCGHSFGGLMLRRVVETVRRLTSSPLVSDLWMITFFDPKVIFCYIFANMPFQQVDDET